jgi:hypothetical protein
MTGWTAADLPSFAGRTAIVTGANSGLGEVTARELARVGAKVILACRNTDKGDAAASGMTGDVEVRKPDLQDLASVRAFAEGVDAVDVLVNNAGIMAVPYAQTVDGFESQIGTNHLGHFALTNLLLPKITDRVVTVSSMMHLIGYISLTDLNWRGPPTASPSWPTCCSPASCSAAWPPPDHASRRTRHIPAIRRRTCRATPATRSARGSLRQETGWPPTRTSARDRRCTRHPRICRATRSSARDSPCGGRPAAARAARWPATQRKPRRCGACLSSSRTPNSHSEALIG